MKLPTEQSSANGPLRQITAEFAAAPKVYQGVADALRKAYKPEEATLPSEWATLINRIR